MKSSRNTVDHPLLSQQLGICEEDNREIDGKEIEELYDPTVDATLEEIAKLTEQFGTARVVIEGPHRQFDEGPSRSSGWSRSLSDNRANAVKEAARREIQIGSQQILRRRHGLGRARPTRTIR